MMKYSMSARISTKNHKVGERPMEEFGISTNNRRGFLHALLSKRIESFINLFSRKVQICVIQSADWRESACNQRIYSLTPLYSLRNALFEDSSSSNCSSPFHPDRNTPSVTKSSLSPFQVSQ
jgi:hypothetical protein